MVTKTWLIPLIRTTICILVVWDVVGLAQAVQWRHDPATPGDWFDEENWIHYSPGTGYYEIKNGGTAQIAGGQAAVPGLWLGDRRNEDASGHVWLSGTGELATGSQAIYNGSIVQTGGSNTPGRLTIESDGRYELSGGTLTITESSRVSGTLDFADGDASVTAGGLVDLGYASLMGASSTSFTLNEDSLLIVPPGFDPAAEFGSFTNHGSLVHQRGSPLIVRQNEGFTGAGVIEDHVECSGRIGTAGESPSVNLTTGVHIRGWGMVNLDSGGLTVENSLSGISDAGQLFSGEQIIGRDGTGRFAQTGGLNSVRFSLRLGHHPGSEGTYELGSLGQLWAWQEYIGERGTGTFVQTGGTNTSSSLYLGYESDSDGTYELGGTAQLWASQEYIGRRGTGEFIQTGGVNTVTGSLSLGGSLDVFCYHTLDGHRCSYTYYRTDGTYQLSGTGRLSAESETVGCYGTGTFVQTGGVHTVSDYLHLAYDSDSEGIYELSGTGQLSVGQQFVGFGGAARFTQTGGSNVIHDILHIGYEPESHGIYIISGGSLATGDLSVDHGTLEIAHPSALVTVSNRLSFGADGNFTAVPEATIHMTGSALENLCTDPNALAGLTNLELIFEGGTGDIDPVEVAGEDMGPVLAGFQDNFALRTLRLGGTDVGRIRLVDEFDNRPGWDGDEALYVWNLNLGPSSYLDLGGLNLYFLNGAVDPSATIVGGAPMLVPEPSTATLFVLGMLLLSAFSRCRLRKPA